MLYRDVPKSLADCMTEWESNGFVTLKAIFAAARDLPLEGDFDSVVRNLLIAFNVSHLAAEKIKSAGEGGNLEAQGLTQYLSDHSLAHTHYSPISADNFRDMHSRLTSDPVEFISGISREQSYPFYSPGITIGYHSDWVSAELEKSALKLNDFSASKRSETAVLVGNGPSLKKVDFKLFEGQDVFISNYAIKNKELNKYAKGVAVTNYLVAEQEPYVFQMGPQWRFFPLWLSSTFSSSEQTVFLNAVGGELRFSENVEKAIFWHSTVSYFWLQILYHAGYRKVLMTGFDNSYQQPKALQEGDKIFQDKDDVNHFDASYFKGKRWQAADTSKMADTYALAKEKFEKDGREIVNCTVGGKLETFRRSELEDELPKRTIFSPRPAATRKPKVAVITSFWEGDASSAELHWRLLNRIGYRNADHIHLFKGGKEQLPLSTMPRVVCADIFRNYPEASQKPHPAGPNLVFAHTVRMLLDTDYTHFFWMEPDCVPTDKDWLAPFLSRLEQYPDQPIHGTGGGTVNPGKPHWKNHFAGCSLYSLKALSQIDWEEYISSDLDVSFDVWLSVKLGYIELLDVNNDDQNDTIIYGKDRYNWRELKRPDALVYGMFEHWRPEKFLTPAELEDRLDWKGFNLYHAVKEPALLKKIYGAQKPSVSTIIINYNNEKFIRDAISSALDQRIENVDYEVIVVDDGSDDRSRSIIEEFGDDVRSIFLEHGVLSASFNQQRGLRTGIEASSGDILLFLDGDDVFAPSKVMGACKMFEKPEVVLGQHTLRLIDENGAHMERSAHMERNCINFPKQAITPDLYSKMGKVNWFQPTSGLALRRCYAMSLKWLLCPDDDPLTWFDVRMSRLAPYFGAIYSSLVPHGSWRRHSASDSIRVDNIDNRVQRHEEWFRKASRVMGLEEVPFKWRDELVSNVRNMALIMASDVLLEKRPESEIYKSSEFLSLKRKMDEVLDESDFTREYLEKVVDFSRKYWS